ncbi:MAG TPA: hypothetical protein VIY48_20940 [Candidatus Paceibacterota bacterium]
MSEWISIHNQPMTTRDAINVALPLIVAIYLPRGDDCRERGYKRERDFLPRRRHGLHKGQSSCLKAMQPLPHFQQIRLTRWDAGSTGGC